MSKLSDYSKFDRLVVEDDDGEDRGQEAGKKDENVQTAASQESSPANQTPPAETTGPQTTLKDGSKSRYVFSYNGRRIYEWEQTLDDVSIYIYPPLSIQKGNQLRVQLNVQRVQVGVTGATQWFLNEATYGLVDVSESTWSLEDDDDNENAKVLVLYLTKAHRGALWEAALLGNPQAQPSKNSSAPVPQGGGSTLDAATKEQVRKELLKERFQEEHPGFDFRDAEFNGSVPDARDFMGGIKHN